MGGAPVDSNSDLPVASNRPDAVQHRARLGDDAREPWLVTIAAPRSLRTEAERWTRDLIAERWPLEGSAPTFAVDDGTHQPDAIVALSAPYTAPTTSEAIDALSQDEMDRVLLTAESRGVPLLLIGGVETAVKPGLLSLDRSAPPSTVVAALAGLCRRAAEVASLQLELELTARVADGVQAEITRLDEELQMAALLQQEFLPRVPPVVEGLSFAALWRPAGSVSGDIYDLFRLDERHIGIFLADAVGHGVPAALQAMMLCRSLTTRDLHDRFQRILNPAEALARLNCDMANRQGRIGRYATAVYAVIDCRYRTMRVASAGSPAPMVFGAHGVRLLNAAGPLLGIDPAQEFEEVLVELAPGDRVLFHSDGFEQAFHEPDGHDAPHGSPVFIPRYVEEFAKLRDASCPDEAVRMIAGLLDVERGSLHQRDDCTLVVVQSKCPGQHSAAA